ncbi:TetR/AcrR family transcriptional regulator [Allostreptomyces psammosilenae]|nr:TetR/AcrR family transcriptional regulator [Allostreptomyces psammosilenae]
MAVQEDGPPPPCPAGDPYDPAGDPPCDRRRGRPRSAAAEAAITDAVLALLAEGHGIADLTIEGIAQRAGVGKATVYRRWPGKDALLAHVVAQVELPVPELPGDSVEDDLVRLCDHIREHAAGEATSGLLRSVIADMRCHPALFAQYKRIVVDRRREALRRVLERGVASGEIRDDVDLQVLGQALAGPMLAGTVLREGTAPTRETAARVVDLVLNGARPRG